ncbi:unnamed protein product [Rotaria magnacalcarata]
MLTSLSVIINLVDIRTLTFISAVVIACTFTAIIDANIRKEHIRNIFRERAFQTYENSVPKQKKNDKDNYELTCKDICFVNIKINIYLDVRRKVVGISDNHF